MAKDVIVVVRRDAMPVRRCTGGMFASSRDARRVADVSTGSQPVIIRRAAHPFGVSQRNGLSHTWT